MNAIMALLTAASVLVHAALGCCIHHTHGLSTAYVDDSVALAKHDHHFGHSHLPQHDHEHPGGDEQAPSWPHRHCDEGGCSAVAARAPVTLLEAGLAKCEAAAIVHVGVAAGQPSLHADYSSLQHDLGPPLRSHLCNLVLLI